MKAELKLPKAVAAYIRLLQEGVKQEFGIEVEVAQLVGNIIADWFCRRTAEKTCFGQELPCHFLAIKGKEVLSGEKLLDLLLKKYLQEYHAAAHEGDDGVHVLLN